jgi:hypothetical protein
VARSVGLSDPETSWLADLLGLPWRRYRVQTHLTKHQIDEALRKLTEPRRLFRPFRRHPANSFEGEIAAAGFKLQRILGYRNGLRPVIEGRFEESPTGVRVVITMRPAWLVTAVVLACVMVTLGLFAVPLGSDKINVLLILPLLLIGYLLVSTSFGMEARWAREILSRVLSGSPY